MPFRVFTEKTDVVRMVIDTPEGLFGILPHRLDCVFCLVPGIMVYQTEVEGEAYLAVNEGFLIKTGPTVLVSVRNAVGGMPLDGLREAVDKEFLKLDEQEKNMRLVLTKLEGGFIRRFMEFHHE